MSNEDFGQFTVGTQHKPVAGIVNVEIPKALADLLAEHVPAVLKSSDLDLTLSARDEKTAKILAGYVKAWGGRQDPKLYIRRLPNRRNQADTEVRFSVQLDSEVDASNRPGRRAEPPAAPAKAK
jgi:hypothetical protein